LETTGLVTVDILDVNDVEVTSISTFQVVSMPVGANGYYFRATASLNCVCEAQGLYYASGAVTYTTESLCYSNKPISGGCGSAALYQCSGGMAIIESIVCTNPAALPTVGGSANNGLVILKGSNFGPCGGPQGDAVKVTATYTNNMDTLEYTATDCAVQPGGNTEIRCTAAAGVGVNHVWNVTIDSSAAHFVGGDSPGGPWSALSTAVTSYKPPTISSIDGGALMSTAGGAVLTLTGTNLPPFSCGSLAACGGNAHNYALSGSQAASVLFQFVGGGVAAVGGAADSLLTFACTGLRVLTPGTVATCTAPTGVGATLWWQVTVGAMSVAAAAQTSVLAQFGSTGYAPPSIAALGPNYLADYAALGLRTIFDLDSSGGDYVLISGRNLGPNFAALLTSSAQKLAPALRVSYGPVTGNGGHNDEKDDGNVFKYEANDCYVLTKNAEILCLTVPGVGANLTWRVEVGGQSDTSVCTASAFNSTDGTYSTAGCAFNLSTSYAAPLVRPVSQGSATTNAVSGAGASGGTTTGGQQIVVSGTEFGPSEGEAAPIVTYGPVGEEDRYSARDCAISVDFTQISCLTAEGVGTHHALVVTVGGQASKVNVANISYSPPNIASYYASWDPTDASGSGIGAATSGGQWVVLQGRNFGTAEESSINRIRYSQTSTDDSFVSTFVPCDSKPHPMAHAPVVVHSPTKDGYYFHARTTPACVCGAYGYEYKGGPVETASTEVCKINYGCDNLVTMGCGNHEKFIASVQCRYPDRTRKSFFD
jgi:hypothetical protein